MAKLNIIKDLRNIYNNLEEKEVVFESSLGEYKIKIKKYLPYEEKRIIIDGAVDGGMDVDTKTVLSKIDRGSMRIVKEYLIIKQYTDIPVLDDILETYNLITASGLKDVVLENIEAKELEEIESGIENEISEFERIEKIASSLGHRLDSIINSVNGDLANTISGLKDLDMNDVIAKQKFISGQNDKIQKKTKK